VIRVLIADQVARIVEDLEKLAPYEDEIDVCGVAHQPSAVIEEAWLRQPDVLLLHETFAGADIAGFTAHLASVSPATQVVLMTPSEAESADAPVKAVVSDVDGGPALSTAIRDAAGVSAAAHITEETVDTSPETTRGRRAHPGRATLIVVFSGKGGAGTSMLAANLVVALAAGVDGRAALVDTDLQFGDAAAMLHVESHLLSIADLAAHGEEIDPALLEEALATGPGEVRVLRSASRPELAEVVTAAALRSIIRALSRKHEYVVIDTPSHLDERTLEAFELADHVLLISTYNMTAIRSTRECLRMLEALGVRGDRVDVVLNQTRPRVSHQREDVEKMLGSRVLVDLPYDPRVDQSIDSGTPFVRAEPRAELSKRIAALALTISAPSSETGTVALEIPLSPPVPTYRRRFSLGRR
jgi:pilus assembly protein CpaE